MNKIKTDVVVIGAGSGGLVAAIGLAKVGYKVYLVEKNKIGGDCTHYGCIPSKSLLHSAREVRTFIKNINEISKEGIIPESVKNQKIEQKANQALEQTREVVKSIADEETPQWLNKNKVNFIKGKAVFKDKQALEVFNNQEKTQINFKFCIIATGSKPFIPDFLKNFEAQSYLTNETLFNLEKRPKDLIILGTGAIGIEMAEAFNNLGTKVSVLNRSQNILKSNDLELSKLLKLELEDKGIKFYFSQIEKIENKNGSFNLTLQNDLKLESKNLLVALGRFANTDLELEKAGVKYDLEGIIINQSCQTSNQRIYAIGDCCEKQKFTHLADQMAQITVLNLALKKYTKIPFNIFKYSKLIPSVVFTDSELAKAGLNENEAIQKYGQKKVRVQKFEINSSDRAKTENEKTGLLKIIALKPFGRIVGVHILAKRAGEILPEFQYYIASKKRIFTLFKIVRAYPTYTSRLSQIVLSWFSSNK
jgi:pyruvate/2-oxoglutarate dehydrogenase complex dihydrolipoamide dehydrogenase (E3) component